MADQQQHEEAAAETDSPQIPTRRVKNIMKLDRDIGKVNSEALFLIASSAALFLRSLAESSARVVIQRKKRTVRVEHLRVAAKRHRPTADFLLDSLPGDTTSKDKGRKKLRTDPFAMRSMDAFFHKCS